ncbi:GntR family transcriptional regulator [Varunaivibrio sulfuroxidans]|uniref:GntR family transcriptional regulator n=1 Tax=Varunaivibrio sulfuroxidans TaxID=1773489 RepID=A0A4R3JD55_9PROT|nr:GntR family transcriptional regulator [Varunaivibrio sulfuroxidans]TCS63083.1 GntR family transcriptional regulator [Varunaivibrio sulfuroxidans]WES31845.1 GntR family transcriptional regulator [Varunaivibrio sulfuroxidans]
MLDPSTASQFPSTRPTRNPLYIQVKQRILDAIRARRWKPGEMLPSEHQLAEEFSVSQGTLRKAIDELVTQNIIIRQQGKGSFIATHTADHSLFYFFHLVDAQNRRELPHSAVRRIRIRRGLSAECARLGLKAGSSLLDIKRVRDIGGAPVINETVLLSAATFGSLKDMSESLPNTLYKLYQEKYDTTVTSAAESLRAVGADEDDADALSIEVGTPILEIDRIAFNLDRQPIEIRISRCRTDRYHYLNMLE